MRIISLQEAATRSNRALRTLQRQIAAGDGPPVVEISPRRRGILETDFENWLLAHQRTAWRCRAPSCICRAADIAALLGQNRDHCREIEALEALLAEKEERIAELEAARR